MDHIKKNSIWANPDIEHASKLMRNVFENRNEAEEVGEKGYAYVKENMNPIITGLEIKNRLRSIMSKNL